VIKFKQALEELERQDGDINGKESSLILLPWPKE
jgi:hypothetical protein